MAEYLPWGASRAPRWRACTRSCEQRLKAVAAWQETGYAVTTPECGTPVSASNFLRRHFYPVAARAGIPTRLQTGIPTRLQTDGTQGLGCGSTTFGMGAGPS
jgi:hypothetical protein